MLCNRLIDNFYLSDEELENSPSRKDGIDQETETTLRIYGAQMIQEAGILLRCPQAVMATGQVLLQRFYCKKSLKEYSIKKLAAAATFLALKLEECTRVRIRDVIMVFDRLWRRHEGTRDLSVLEPGTKEYQAAKDSVIRYERDLLRVFGFIVHCDHPHKLMVSLLTFLKAPEELYQAAWNIANDSLRTTLCVRFKSEVIATGVIFYAARKLQVPLPDSACWWRAFSVETWQVVEVVKCLHSLYQRPKAGFVNVQRDPAAGAAPKAPTPELTTNADNSPAMPDSSNMVVAGERGLERLPTITASGLGPAPGGATGATGGAGGGAGGAGAAVASGAVAAAGGENGEATSTAHQIVAGGGDGDDAAGPAGAGAKEEGGAGGRDRGGDRRDGDRDRDRDRRDRDRDRRRSRSRSRSRSRDRRDRDRGRGGGSRRSRSPDRDRDRDRGGRRDRDYRDRDRDRGSRRSRSRSRDRRDRDRDRDYRDRDRERDRERDRGGRSDRDRDRGRGEGGGEGARSGPASGGPQDAGRKRGREEEGEAGAAKPSDSGAAGERSGPVPSASGRDQSEAPSASLRAIPEGDGEAEGGGAHSRGASEAPSAGQGGAGATTEGGGGGSGRDEAGEGQGGEDGGEYASEEPEEIVAME